MTPMPNPNQRQKYLTMFVVAVVLTVLYMVYLASIDASLPLVTRRPGGRPIVTWQRDPTGYLLAFVPMLFGMFVFVVVIAAVAEAIQMLVRSRRAHPFYHSRSRSETPLRVTSAVLSLIIPGLGHAFSLHFVRAAIWLMTFIAATILSLLIFRYVPTFVGLVLPIIFVVALRIAVAVDASRLELNRPGFHWPRRLVGIGTFLVTYFAAMFVWGVVRYRAFGESVLIPSASMEPTLMQGDYVLTTPLSGVNVSRNRIIMFRWPDEKSNRYVARAVGLPGDTLSMRNGKLFLNGHDTPEPFAYDDGAKLESTYPAFAWQKNFLSDSVNSGAYLPTRTTWGPVIVPRHAFFVLGDNRNNALDSRYRGFVAESDVSLSPDRVYYSRDPVTGFRWQRFGKTVRSSNAQ